jgi:cysteine desulfurase
VEEARARIARAIGARPEEIVLTSGGTEASNLAIFGAAGGCATPLHVVTTAIEHPATAEPCAELERRGARISRISTDANGVVDLDAIARAIEDGAGLVTIIHAHNETGVIQPIERVTERARRARAVVHADAAQSLGKIRVDVDELGVDLLSIAGHKLGAPKGVGALYVRAGCALVPLLRGASHEGGRRPGTENVASIVGLGVACEVVSGDVAQAGARMRGLRERLWDALAAAIPGIARHGLPDGVLPSTLSVRFPGARGVDVLERATDVAASTGSACHDGHDVAPAAIVAMGVTPAEAIGTVRLTLGRATSREEIDDAARSLIGAWSALRGAPPDPAQS